MKVTLMEAGTGNGSDKVFSGGKAVLMAEASFGVATIKLQIKLPSGAYFDVANASLTAAGISAVVELPAGTYRAAVGLATAANVYLVGV